MTPLKTRPAKSRRSPTMRRAASRSCSQPNAPRTCCASPPPAASTTANRRSSAACSTTRATSTKTRSRVTGHRTTPAHRLRPAHRRPARRARTGHHHRRRLPLLLHPAPQIHHRRHAGPRAVHAQHGHRRIHRGCRHHSRRRAQGHPRPDRAATPTSPRCSAFRTSSPPSTRWTSSTSLKKSSRAIERDFCRRLRAASRFPTSIAIPVSALEGDNVVAPSSACPGTTARACSNSSKRCRSPSNAHRPASAFPCSASCGPHQDFRGFAGQIAAGTVRPGDAVIALPSGPHAACAPSPPGTATCDSRTHRNRSSSPSKTNSTSAAAT